MTRIVIMGGGPAGYEAALVAAQHGADVTIVEKDGLGGACVLYDCVPSKTFIASSGALANMHGLGELGIITDMADTSVDLRTVHGRVKGLALAQSADIRARVQREGVKVLTGEGRFDDDEPGLATHKVRVTKATGDVDVLDADVVLIATGATPRVLPGAVPDGERILDWRQLYDLPELPEHLVVVGSGVTGAEFASAYTEMGVKVTLVSSRDRVLPHEDADAAAVLEEVFAQRGNTVVKHARAERVERTEKGVEVHLQDGRVIEGTHALMTVGSVPNTKDIGLEKVGIEPGPGGFITVDRVSRTSVPGIYAAGDCTGVLMLASVASMQGRIAMWHALGEGVAPIKLKTVAANVFTHPEIATVGISQSAIDSGAVPARTIMLPLATNARAKMEGLRRGFVKLFCRPATGVIVGGVVVAPTASELILPIALAVQNQLTVDHLALTFAVYPSLSGSITEAARQLMRHDDLD
ncbi:MULTISPECIES: NAD(P)H-quinone dehydrogenase [Amycolatopsis]|uniref:NAD(P)H-quinone dehydrogenase n=1 Tax=Amycolatopsis thermalba TaxID=944492 RepID=A0ABY4NQD8_9PSEU|nr:MULTISPECIES: NAD(P)H-quinone dehydrogenase [Amycolatopsis]OXM61741.1 NAD(P)H-quinone dehydrogenase [Amycolatopsis sp. KNN50.9b]UQS22558.1 NAD(P)H-quinone dehydrogenase [Amycolatopsis thermalba]